jgi:hypothetical protein
VAVLGLVMAHAFNTQLDRRLAALEINAEARQAFDAQRDKLAGAEIPERLGPAMQATLKQAIEESFVAGFRRVIAVTVALALLSSLVAWLFIERSATAKV